MTNGEILKLFKERYSDINVIDYRPLCPELFTNDLVGVTIWLDNGDVLQYYPREAQPIEKIIKRSKEEMTGKEILSKYCQEHSGEEIYNFLRRLFDESMSWTDSRGFIIEWLDEGDKNES